MPKAPTVYDFMKRFPDDDACLEHVMRLRYGETFDCPSCGRNGRYSRIKKRPVYQCSYCSHQISPKVGTPFQKSRTPLQKMVLCHFPVHHDAARRIGEGNPATNRRDLQGRVAHGP